MGLGVIAVCAVFDVWALGVGLRSAEDDRPAVSRNWFPKVSFAQTIHASADPAVFEVLAEDSASLLGLAFAAAGIVGSAYFGWLAADGLAAIAIGLLLVIVAGVLIREIHSLLTGEAAAPSALEEAKAIFCDDPRIDHVCEVLSIQLGPREIQMAATLDFRDDLSGPVVEAAASELTRRLRAADPRITRLFLRPGQAVD